MSRAKGIKFGVLAMVLQTVYVLIFAFLADYHPSADPKTGDSNPSMDLMKMYPPFQDVHVMIFIGFGFLMTFLRRYGYSAISINLFLGGLMIQWALIVRGCISMFKSGDSSFTISIDDMFTADFAVATVLISFGAVLGKTSPIQLIIMATVEVVAAQFNGWLCHDKLHAVDLGESMYIHAFGAYFGLAVSRVLYNENVNDSKKSESMYHSDLFSMIGTIFLWLYWPSFNGGGASGDEQHRAFVNTYLSLCGCTIVTFAFSALYDKNGKLTMEHIQNATLAGGVAVGTTANMPLQPYGALLMGCASGLISITGFRFISGAMSDKLKIQDTCGVHNLHGLPAVLAATAGAIMAAMSSEENWGRSMYEIFPAMIPENNTTEYATVATKFAGLDMTDGSGLSSSKQGAYQFLALLITMGIAIVSGILTGFLLKIPILDNVSETEDLFEDMVFWNLPEEEDEEEKMLKCTNLKEDFLRKKEEAMNTLYSPSE